jgi:hypothetical protein
VGEKFLSFAEIIRLSVRQVLSAAFSFEKKHGMIHQQGVLRVFGTIKKKKTRLRGAPGEEAVAAITLILPDYSLAKNDGKACSEF